MNVRITGDIIGRGNFAANRERFFRTPAEQKFRPFPAFQRIFEAAASENGVSASWQADSSSTVGRVNDSRPNR